MTAEAGHFANRCYIDQNGAFHLNGASFFDSSEVDIAAGVNVVGLTATAAELNVLAGVTAGTVTASKGLVVDAAKNLDILGLTQTNAGIGASTAAAGSTLSDAGALPAGTAQVYPTTAADDTKGVKIHANDKVTGRKLHIGNGVSNKILKVYGPSGATINGASADAAFSSASGKGVVIVCLSGSGNSWLAF